MRTALPFMWQSGSARVLVVFLNLIDMKLAMWNTEMRYERIRATNSHKHISLDCHHSIFFVSLDAINNFQLFRWKSTNSNAYSPRRGTTLECYIRFERTCMRMSWFSWYAGKTYRFTLIAQSFRFICRSLSVAAFRNAIHLVVAFGDVVGAVFPFHFSCHSLTCIQFDFTFILMRISFRLGLGWFHTVDIMILVSVRRRHHSATRSTLPDLSCINVLDEPIVFILFLLLFGMFFALFFFSSLVCSTFRQRIGDKTCVLFIFISFAE